MTNEINEVTFADLGLSDEMLAAVHAKGFETPTAIQKLTIPLLLEGTSDIIAQSQTGTGKTAAFGLPILQRLEAGRGSVQAIVLVPTRELALQAAEELQSLNADRHLSITAIYGGAAISEQLRRLKRGVDVVVGTPGRVLDHIRRGTLVLDNVKYLVLDEADEMLNMGFVEDVEEIMSHTGEDRRVLLFSATMPERIVRLAEQYMHDTQQVRVESQNMTADLTNQIYFEVRESDKFDALTRIIDVEPDFYGIVFCRTKIDCDALATRLAQRGYSAEGLHGDVSQAMREKILRKFREKVVNILVATDVAARGIDVSNLSHVINYALPQDTESYVHRIGRTGRAGREGTAITFISSSEYRRFNGMMRDIQADVRKEQLPSPQDIVAMKRARISEDLREIMQQEMPAAYDDMADEILAEHDPRKALSALLRLAFRSELDESSYPEIRSFSVDRKGKARLFLAIGTKDGYSPRKIVDLLKHKCGLRDKNIDDLCVRDTFSFVSVPFADAEAVIGKINRQSRGRKIARMADPEKNDQKAPRKAPRKETSEAEMQQVASQMDEAMEFMERAMTDRRDEGKSRRKREDWNDEPRRKRDDRGEEPRRKREDEPRRKQPRRLSDEPHFDEALKEEGESRGGFNWDAFRKFEDELVWERQSSSKRAGKKRAATRSVRKGSSPLRTGRAAAAKRIARKGRK